MNHIDVLDNGFVHLVDVMGSDQRVLDAARVSTGASSKGDKKDQGLINYLMKNEHETPFEKLVFEFHIKCPIFVARQWFRHRMGSYNEVSARYKEFKFETYTPSDWRQPGTNNHQGSVPMELSEEDKKHINDTLKIAYTVSRDAYYDLLNKGVAKELARLVLPMGHYTEFYWTVNFRSLMNFIRLRADSHAQLEIQEYANAIMSNLESIEDIKWSVNAFKEFKLSR